jgi:NACHT domain-containing protein
MSKTNLVRTSRDGDQFHYLWASRRCLRLLSAKDDLVAISIEGPSPGETIHEPSTAAGEEVIDIAEYFGSEEIQRARLVRYMQLKHSTLHATEPWTASGLEKTVKGFAKRYQELLQMLSAEVLASKFEFWLITNRPISSKFAEAVADVATGAAPRHPGELKKLEEFTGLEGELLAAFSKLLHFEDRQDDYWDQRNILFQDVSGYLPDADVDGPLKLKELVTRKALSEAENNPTITRADVLRALGTEENRLFPAPCVILSPDAVVPRAQEPELIRAIVGATAPVIVHATAGVGKTVFATRIAGALPEGSTCILYDCFGNGQYRNASGYRHRYKDALIQIANDLAAKGLCHPLIPTSHADAAAYVRAFLHRISQAAEIVRVANSHALLCIVVDAADNAQMAAEEIGEARSFVRDLIREKAPINVRLVFLSRTHRQDMLDPPVDAIRLELRPFIQKETASYLRQRFPNASERDIDEFHRLSSQNPRVQALALSRNDTLPNTLRLLGPNPTTIEDAIGSLLQYAIAKLKDRIGLAEKAHVDRICAGLATLRPLIPIPILSRMSGVAEEAIKSFALDLGRPLLLAGDSIQFFDEPAETWFREKFQPSAEAMEQFIAGLKPLAAASAYVASVLPQLMLGAGRFSDLVELALTSAALPDTSPLEKRDVELQRLQFALKAGLRAKRYLDAAKLALKAGGETAGDDRRRKILQANTDLAAAFLETNSIQEIVSRRTFGSSWLGSHYAYEAALLSGPQELLGDARSRLRMAYEWLHNWHRLTPEERRQTEISYQDIAELTMARINIHGPADGAHSLRTWRPRDVSFRVGQIVARRLIDHGRFREVNEFGHAAGNNLWLVLAVTVELREIQRVLPSDVTRRVFRLVVSRHINWVDRHAWDDREPVLNAITALVEACLQQGICTAGEAIAVLSRYLPSEPPRALSSRFANSRFPVLRAYCLRAALRGQALELRDLAHPELRADMDKGERYSKSSDLQEFEEVIGPLLPWHQLSAAILLGQVTKASLNDQLKRTRELSAAATKIYYRDHFHTSNEVARLWIDILHRLDAADSITLADFLEWKEKLKRPLFTPTLTTLARVFGQREATKSTALLFALEAFDIEKNERSGAENKFEGYLDAARAILTVSKVDAKAFFDEAVEVASKIGDENLARWDAILDLADRAARLDRPSPETAYHFARCAELTYDYVDRDKYFSWNATVEALCDLCPSSALAILSRWRDRGFGRSEEVLAIAIERLIERGRADSRDALPFITFRAEWSYELLLDKVLAACATHSEKEVATAYLYRYMRFGDGKYPGIKEVASKHGLTIPGIDEVISFEEKRKQTDRKSAPNPVDQVIGTKSEPAKDWDKIFKGADLRTADGVARAYSALRKTPPPFDNELFFTEAIRRVPLGSETTLIAAVGDMPEFSPFLFGQFLKQVPDVWKARPGITQALAVTLKAFCRRYCMIIARSRRYELLPLEMACAVAGIGEADLAEAVLRAVGETPDLADSHRIFSLVGLLVMKLSEDEALEALKFGLELFTPVLEDKDGDGPWSSESLPPADIKASLAGYIWTAMAAPEGVMRWQGSHAVLGLVTLGRDEMLGHIIKLATERKGRPFVDARLPFYSLHALQWFLIGMARGATEFPATLAPFADQIVNWALTGQPHVLIRQFAARTALVLIERGLITDRDNLKERLTHVNVSALPVVESNRYKHIPQKMTGTSTASDDDRYYFGPDFGPYWLAPLGLVFGLPQEWIETEALNVIRTCFGFMGKGRWYEDERSRRKLYEENHTYYRGSHPRADTLHFYYAYHAMMVVAGKLLANTSTHRALEFGHGTSSLLGSIITISRERTGAGFGIAGILGLLSTLAGRIDRKILTPYEISLQRILTRLSMRGTCSTSGDTGHLPIPRLSNRRVLPVR